MTIKLSTDFGKCRMAGDECRPDYATYIQTDAEKELRCTHTIRWRYTIENDLFYRLEVPTWEAGTDVVTENWGIKKSPYWFFFVSLQIKTKKALWHNCGNRLYRRQRSTGRCGRKVRATRVTILPNGKGAGRKEPSSQQVPQKDKPPLEKRW